MLTVQWYVYWTGQGKATTTTSKFNGHRCPSFNAHSSHRNFSFPLPAANLCIWLLRNIPISLHSPCKEKLFFNWISLRVSFLTTDMFACCRIAKASFCPFNFWQTANYQAIVTDNNKECKALTMPLISLILCGFP